MCVHSKHEVSVSHDGFGINMLLMSHFPFLRQISVRDCITVKSLVQKWRFELDLVYFSNRKKREHVIILWTSNWIQSELIVDSHNYTWEWYKVIQSLLYLLYKRCFKLGKTVETLNEVCILPLSIIYCMVNPVHTCICCVSSDRIQVCVEGWGVKVCVYVHVQYVWAGG